MNAKNQISKHEYFMREALKEAEIALQNGNWPIGAVVVLDDEIIARSSNKVYSDVDKTHHAEMLALQQAATALHNQGRRATLYTTYELCPMCLGAALVNHVGTIVCGPDLDGSGALQMIDHLPQKFLLPKYGLSIRNDILPRECIEIALRGIPEYKLQTEKVKSLKKMYTTLK